MPGGDGVLPTKNYVHEMELWRQRMDTEVAVAKEWKDNWGFLAKHGGSEPRGFTTNMVKYSTGGGAWNVKPIRIPDDSTEGYEAARSEQVARERMSSLEWTTAPANPTKKVDDRYGRPLVHDQYRGVESRDAAKRLVTHSRQALGEASQTEGIDPNQKYSYPMTSLQEIGWRAPSTNNKNNPLEMFGVCQFARNQVCKKERLGHPLCVTSDMG